MLNAATRRATAANTSSTVSKKPMKALSTSAFCSAVSCAPVIAVAPAGERGLELPHQFGLRHARLGADEHAGHVVTCRGGADAAPPRW